MIKVYGRRNSSNVAKVMWTLVELDLPHERIDAGGPYGVTTDQAYLAMNPNGLVPVLVDGPVCVWESNAVVRYLGARYGNDSFWPSDAGIRALSDRWMDWGSLNFYPKVVDVFRTSSNGGEPYEAALAAILEPCRILDQALRGRDFIAGVHLSIGDIALGVHLGRLFRYPDARLNFTELRRYHERLLTRSGYLEHAQSQLL